MNIEHTTFIQIAQGPNTKKYSLPMWSLPPTIIQESLSSTYNYELLN